MKIINFAHAVVYALGVYLFITIMDALIGFYPLALILSIIAIIPVGFIMERFVIRRLYGESLDYAIIATYAMLLIGTDFIKAVWGTTPKPVSNPIGMSVTFLGVHITVYRIVIFASAVTLFIGMRVFFKRTIIGKIVEAALEDREEVRCLGINVNKYFSFMFILGCVLAVIGGILYAPISAADPYMGFHILLISFAVIMVGGMGSLTGTFFSAFALGMVIALTGRFWSQAAETMVFIILAAVLIFQRFRFRRAY
jgi:branched-subunit amino acid ABC-type transport system permease component